LGLQLLHVAFDRGELVSSDQDIPAEGRDAC